MPGKTESISAVIYSFLSKVTTYLLLLVFANLFLKEEYGKAAFVMAVFTLIAFSTRIGVPYILIPWIAKNKDTSSIFYLLLSINAVVVISALIYSINYPWIIPIVLTLPFLVLRGFGSAFLQSKYRYDLTQKADLFYVLIVLIISFLSKDLGKLGIILAYSLGYILTSSWLVYLSRNDFKNIIKFRFDIQTIKEYLTKGIIVSVFYISFSFLTLVDTTILGFLSTHEKVAEYNIAGSISNALTMIPIALSAFILTRSADKNEKNPRYVLKRTINISYSSSLIMGIIIISIIGFLIKLFFPKYVGIEPFIAILMTGILFYSVYIMLFTSVLGNLEPKKAIPPILTAALLNILLDFLLIPKYGLYGIAFATLIAHSAGFTIFSIREGFFFRLIGVYFLSSLILIAFYLNLYGLLLLIPAVIFLFIFKLITIEDILVLKQGLIKFFSRSK